MVIFPANEGEISLAVRRACPWRGSADGAIANLRFGLENIEIGLENIKANGAHWPEGPGRMERFEQLL